MAKLEELEVGDIVRIVNKSQGVVPSYRCLRITSLKASSFADTDVQAQFLGWDSGQPDSFISRWSQNLILHSRDLEKIA